MQPRVGHINFLNCLPLTYSLLQCGYHKGMSLALAVPAVLNKSMLEEKLDISPMSSIAYARMSDKLLLLPNIGIVSDGSVQSIILVSRKPIENMEGEKIILTAQSATSHCLLKIIMQKGYNCSPLYRTAKVDPVQLFAENDESSAILLIGDDALYVNHNRMKNLYYYDLGSEWKKLTGLPMVYAVWAVNSSFLQSHKKQAEKIYIKLRGGFDNGIKNKLQVVNWAETKTPFSRQQLFNYFDVIMYNVGQKELRALAVFYKYAVECGLLSVIPSMEMMSITNVREISR
ncbi:menaquinone biosynthesis protein [Pectinatus sottacetonis]|uniref:menaquinone biosynthesis protein n=1 Tax=Pectinatus sottacetonis TaxID=1002795 RepID=UPI0018C4DD30|nr:menaquinone biosynthesis protein [Pectinatus sottacetonis]